MSGPDVNTVLFARAEDLRERVLCLPLDENPFNFHATEALRNAANALIYAHHTGHPCLNLQAATRVLCDEVERLLSLRDGTTERSPSSLQRLPEGTTP